MQSRGRLSILWAAPDLPATREEGPTSQAQYILVANELGRWHHPVLDWS